MKLILTLSLFLSGFLCVTCQAQIDFENGYFIKNDGQKISCLIRNYGWRNNPTKFVYKENENAPAKTITLDEVVEFGILPGVKYQRYTVKLDTSDDNLESMSKSWLPEFRQQQVFLKVLVEGKASLYIYRTREWTRFFFRINDITPEPLIFKRYSNR